MPTKQEKDIKNLASFPRTSIMHLISFCAMLFLDRCFLLYTSYVPKGSLRFYWYASITYQKKNSWVLCGEEYSTRITDISRKIEDYKVCKREANL